MAKKPQPGMADHLSALDSVLGARPSLVVLQGPEMHLRKTALALYLSALSEHCPGIDPVRMQGPVGNATSPSITDLMQELSGGSLFSSAKVVVVDPADKLLFPTATAQDSPRSRTSPLDRFLDIINNVPPETWLILCCDKLQKNRKIGKALSSQAAIVPCPSLTRSSDVGAWLSRKAMSEGKRLADGVADILFTAHGGNLGTLQGELEKLCLYTGERESIGTEDVERFLSGTIEFDVFGLTNALESRNTAQAMVFARRIGQFGTRDQSGKKTDGTGSCMRALSMVARTMENIFAARVVLSSNGGPSDVAAKVGTSPWRAEHLCRAGALFSLGELRQALDFISAEMAATHDTAADPAMSLERVVLACCQKHSF